MSKVFFQEVMEKILQKMLGFIPTLKNMAMNMELVGWPHQYQVHHLVHKGNKSLKIPFIPSSKLVSHSEKIPCSNLKQTDPIT